MPLKTWDSFFHCVCKIFTSNFIPELYAQGDTGLFSLSSGQTHGDSVTQTEGQVTISEDASLTINCTYITTSFPTLFWYVQYPGEGPQLLLKASRDQEKGSNKGFVASYNRDSKSFHLEKGSVQESDSAVYYCVMNDAVTGTAGGAVRNL